MVCSLLLFIAGFAVGTVMIAVNLYLLKKVIGLMCRKKKFVTGMLIHLVRYIIYGSTVMAVYKTNMIMLIGCVISIILFPIAMALYMMRKEDANGKL